MRHFLAFPPNIMLPQRPHRRLAFVDVETTGLDPAVNRITEIGIIAVDGDQVEERTTFVDPLTPPRAADATCDELPARRDDAPAFREIARSIAALLSGRLFVAHNARFDYAFLRAEFRRVGIAFEAEVLCSVMLSRKLRPDCSCHDLDALMNRHGLTATARHRALPDASVVWQFWQAIHRHHAPPVIASAIEALLAGPVLPPDLDAALIDRLPESPGTYCLHDEHDALLVVGPADNVKRQVLDYFRLDVASRKALALAHRVRKITWRTTRGAIGARLQAATLARQLSPTNQRNRRKDLWTWHFTPDTDPCMTLVALDDAPGSHTYGIYDSPRKARNALARLATGRELCPSLLGLSTTEHPGCATCTAVPCNGPGDRSERAKGLTRAFVALRPWQLPAWPHDGPVGIRERGELHVVDRWRYLGTARNESDIAELLRARPPAFDKRMLRLLGLVLGRVAPTAVVRLERYAQTLAAAEPETG
jgi:DNA polymerase-3 subunit epsilon